MRAPAGSRHDRALHRLLDPYVYNNLLAYTEDVVYVNTERNKRSYEYQLCLLSELHLTFIKQSALSESALTVDSALSWYRYDEIQEINVMYDKPEFFSDQSMIDACVHIQIMYMSRSMAGGVQLIDVFTFYEDSRLLYMLQSLWFNYYTYIALQPVYDHIDIASLNSVAQHTLYTYLENALCSTAAVDYRAKVMCCQELSVAVASNRGMKHIALSSGKLITYIVDELYRHKQCRLLCTQEYIAAHHQSINSVQMDALQYIVSLMHLLNRMLVGGEMYEARINLIHTTSTTQTLDQLFETLLLHGTSQANTAVLATMCEQGIVDDEREVDVSTIYGLIEQFDVSLAELIHNLLSICEYSALTALQHHAAVSVDTLVCRFTDPNNTAMCMQYLVDLCHRICDLLQVHRQPAVSYYLYCCIHTVHQLCARSVPICTHIKQHCTNIFQTHIVAKSHHNNILPDINASSMFYYVQAKKQVQMLLYTLGMVQASKLQFTE